MAQLGSRDSSASAVEIPLLPLSEPSPQLPVTDRIFYQAYEQCKLSVTLQLIYASGLVLSTPYFIFSLPFSRLQLYLILLFLIEIFQFYYYNTLRHILRSTRVYYKLAQRTDHLRKVAVHQLPSLLITAEPRYLLLFDFQNPAEGEQERRVKQLSHEIHTTLVEGVRTIKIMHRMQFLFYQIAHTFALLLLLFHDFADAPAAKNLLILVVLVGTYQYLEFYLLIIFLLIVLPYYFFKNSYNYAVLKYRSYKLEQNLHSERFSQKMAGDKECKICLMPYESGQTVIVLKCNELHNFHASCLRQWTKNSVTCPMCRANLCEI